MTQEEKAKAYDEAIERSKNYYSTTDSASDIKLIGLIFPELKESEDERMVKFIKKQLFNIKKTITENYELDAKLTKAIDWLEKQGNLMKALQISNAKIGELIEKNYYLKEQLEKQSEHTNFLNKIQIGDKVTRNEDGVLVNISQLNRVAKKDEKQGENNMGISEATKQKLEDNLNKALEKETPESCNEFLEKQGSKKENLKERNICDTCEDSNGCLIPCCAKLLEKQGEQKMKTPEESLGIDSDTYNKIVDECVYGEQKPDKVKPKFCDGDWVVYCNDDVDLITGIEENGYSINNGGYIPFICENEMRLWDITDAKVGDVLVSESTCGLGTWYCIFKSLDGDESMTVYCYLARDGRFETKKELCFDKEPYNTKPATKEQRDTLMKAMADAGYTFDFEKKELKKVEQKPAWGEKDKKMHDFAIRAIGLCKQYAINHQVNGYSNLPDVPKKYEELQDWLISLKPQFTWKPSDEQIDALEDAIADAVSSIQKNMLNSLYNDLIKLK